MSLYVKKFVTTFSLDTRFMFQCWVNDKKGREGQGYELDVFFLPLVEYGYCGRVLLKCKPFLISGVDARCEGFENYAVSRLPRLWINQLKLVVNLEGERRDVAKLPLAKFTHIIFFSRFSKETLPLILMKIYVCVCMYAPCHCGAGNSFDVEIVEIGWYLTWLCKTGEFENGTCRTNKMYILRDSDFLKEH